jgi:hypothetical protein
VYKEIIFQKKVNALAFLLFFIGMGISMFLEWLPIWAAAMASAFVAVTLRQFMIGRLIDIFASLAIFGLLFVTNTYHPSELWTGVILILGSLYVFIRQCFEIYEFKLYHARKGINKEQPEDEDDPDD